MVSLVSKGGVPCYEELGEGRDCVISLGDQTLYFQQRYLRYVIFCSVYFGVSVHTGEFILLHLLLHQSQFSFLFLRQKHFCGKHFIN